MIKHIKKLFGGNKNIEKSYEEITREEYTKHHRNILYTIIETKN